MFPKKQQLTSEQLKRLKRLAIALDEKNPVVSKNIFDVEDALEAKIATIQDSIETVKQGRGETGAQGIRGEKGEKGDKGDAGKDGKDGAKGKDGKDGKDGADGKDGFVDVATVAYLEDEIKQVKSLAKNNMRDGIGLVVRQLRAGTGVTIDDSNQEYPTISATSSSSSTFEYVSKNIESYPMVMDSVSRPMTVVYTTPTGTITKTLNFTGSVLTSIVLSGDLPITLTETTKTLNYTDDVFVGYTYS